MRGAYFARVRKTYFRYCFNCRKEVAARIYYLVQWNLNGTLMSSMAERTPHFPLHPQSRTAFFSSVFCARRKPPKNTMSRMMMLVFLRVEHGLGWVWVCSWAGPGSISSAGRDFREMRSWNAAYANWWRSVDVSQSAQALTHSLGLSVCLCVVAAAVEHA